MSERVLLEIDNLPIQQNRVYSSAEEAKACTHGDMLLVQNDHTGLVYNTKFDPELMVYDKNYQNEQAYSLVFQQHLGDVLEIIKKHFSNMRLTEIGCGKGWFLEFMRKNGIDVIGIDPAYEGNADYVIKAPFTSKLNIKSNGLILRHVLEHIPDPLSFLESISNANGNSGLIYIEVPCFDWILEHKAWFDIFYEHVNYFRLSDFFRIFDEIIESGHLFGGQYIYIVADIAKLNINAIKNSDQLNIPDDFFSQINEAVGIIQNKNDKKVAIWGGSSKGVIFSYFLMLNNVKPDVIIDINEAKQGKYLPATGFKVISYQKAKERLNEEDIIFVMNSNYLDEIRKETSNMYQYILVEKIHEKV